MASPNNSSRSAKPEGTEFHFITFTNPAETRREGNRRYVRTQVLKKYHAQRRSIKEKALDQAKQPGRAIAPKEDDSQTQYASSPEPGSSCSTAPSTPSIIADAEFDSSIEEAFPFPVTPELSHHDRYFMDRYMELAHSMDVLTDARRQNTLATYTLPTAMNDPITLNCMLLTGAQCLARSDKDSKTQSYAHYYAGYYRGHLLQSIHQALDDEQKTISDSTIAGLVKLETDEYLAGDQEHFNLHANALREIVNMCGGLHKLGMNGYLSELVIRIDQAAASLFGSEPFFPQNSRLSLDTSVDSFSLGILSPAILPEISEFR